MYDVFQSFFGSSFTIYPEKLGLNLNLSMK